MRVFQIVDGKCAWETDFSSVSETFGKYPKCCLFVEAPDYVSDLWGYREIDDEGNPVYGDDRFVKPIPPEGYVYDDLTRRFYPESEYPKLLERDQKTKQDQNKTLFAKFLSTHPLTWIDGKTYGVTMEDQTEIQLNISQYQIQIAAGVENPVLEWHDIHKSCEPWTLENLSALVLSISEYVYPWFRKMQDYKSRIYSCTTSEEINAIKLVYKTEEELAAEEAAKSNNKTNSTEEETIAE